MLSRCHKSDVAVDHGFYCCSYCGRPCDMLDSGFITRTAANDYGKWNDLNFINCDEVENA